MPMEMRRQLHPEDLDENGRLDVSSPSSSSGRTTQQFSNIRRNRKLERKQKREQKKKNRFDYQTKKRLGTLDGTDDDDDDDDDSSVPHTRKRSSSSSLGSSDRQPPAKKLRRDVRSGKDQNPRQSNSSASKEISNKPEISAGKRKTNLLDSLGGNRSFFEMLMHQNLLSSAGKNVDLDSQLDAIEEEDRNIKRLEKKLGKTASKEFDDLFSGISVASLSNEQIRKLASEKKSAKATTHKESLEESDSEMNLFDQFHEEDEEEDEEETGDDSEEEEEEEGADEDSDLGDLEDEETLLLKRLQEIKKIKAAKKSREIEEDQTDDDGQEEGEEDESDEEKEKEGSKKSGKYVPPHLRKLLSSEPNLRVKAKDDPVNDPNNIELRKKLRGLLNRMSEQNLSVILASIQGLYLENPTNLMNALLSHLILMDFSNHSLHSSMTPVYASLITILHLSVGISVGGVFITMFAERFHHKYNEKDRLSCVNLILLLGFLYSFEVIHCILIYDLIRMMTQSFSPIDIEVLLSLLKNIGLQLRSDDPLALKEIILLMQTRHEQIKLNGGFDLGADSKDFALRSQFMLELIYDLKNNKKINNTINIDKLKDMVNRAKKGAISGDLKIKVAWSELISPENIGKWWNVTGFGKSGSNLATGDLSLHQQSTGLHSFNSELLQLAKAQRMTSDTRVAIFCTMMTSEDYMDAFERLLKLNLKGKQDRDVVYVILSCCAQEATFNMFYAHLAEKFCKFNHNYKFTFQFQFWDRFQTLNDLPSHKLSNLALLLAHMLSSHSLALSVLKKVDFTQMQNPVELAFFRMVMVSALVQNPELLVEQAEKYQQQADLQDFRDNLLFFVQKGMKKINSLIPEGYDVEKLKKSLRQLKKVLSASPFM